MKKTKLSVSLGSRELILETGVYAKQADGSILSKCGDNVVLTTVVSSTASSNLDFFPMTVELQERFYATGKFPGGYFKREGGRPGEQNVLSCRLIDRPIRPLFPDGYNYETQIVSTVLSSDGLFPFDILAGIGTSAALHISDIPFAGPSCTVRLGKIQGDFVLNPTPDELAKSDMDMVVAGTKKGILMVEGNCKFLEEDEILKALQFAHKSFEPVLEMQEELRNKVGATKRDFTPHSIDDSFRKNVQAKASESLKKALKIKDKQDRYAEFSNIKDQLISEFVTATGEEEDTQKRDVSTVFEDLKYDLSREMILSDRSRIDARKCDEVRPITCETGLLPRAHGSAVFTRGETQVLAATTLGTSDDAQTIDTINGYVTKNFMLHYNFPPFCVGESGRLGGQSRREIGHGFLAERSLSAILPSPEDFPYTIRLVSEVLESNGSSSMGTVCSGMMSLLDAGVPVTQNVAGIAMGLIKEGDKFEVLSDILGDEDHLGDMDFKVAGSRDGVTALQMDIKIDSVSVDILKKALQQAKVGRCHILDEMEKVISKTRHSLSDYVPKIETIKIKPDKVRDVIGPGGKVVRNIISTTGVKVDINDDGIIKVASADAEARKRAMDMINNIVAEAEVGKSYLGKVVKVLDFGAFVEVLPNTTGLLHISEIDHKRVRNVADYMKEGDEVNVKVLDIDRTGKIKLSRKALL